MFCHISQEAMVYISVGEVPESDYMLMYFSNVYLIS